MWLVVVFWVAVVTIAVLMIASRRRDRRWERELNAAAEVIQDLVDAEFEKCGGTPDKGSALDQAGLRDGATIISEHLVHHQHDLAVAHLVYMIHETGIAVPVETGDFIRAMAEGFGIDESGEHAK